MSGSAPVQMPQLVTPLVPLHYVTALNILQRIGVDFSRVVLLAAGTYENYKGEVRRQQPPPGTPLDDETLVTLEVGFPSAVDWLPYQFFHGLGPAVGGREWEDRARRLMAPFDSAVVRYDSLIEYTLLKIISGCFERRQVEAFIRLFGIETAPTPLSDRELVILSLLLPGSHDWAGNPDRVAEALALFFGCTWSFRVVEGVRRSYGLPESMQCRLGKARYRLGEESVLGAEFSDPDSACRLVVSGVSPADLEQLRPGRPARIKLEWLLELFMPADLEYEIVVVPAGRCTRLGRSEAGSFLGMGSYLGEKKLVQNAVSAV